MVLAHDLKNNQRTKDVEITKDVTFDLMLLSAKTLEGLRKSGFIRPSPIQLHGIPLGKCGFDLLMEAKSGTGKTAVFAIIALEKLDLSKGLQVVILAPTREIAAQICDVLRQIGCQYKGLFVELVIGGLSVQEDIEKFKGRKVHIVVGSPGRLRHLISERHLDVSGARLLVLDEADKLMDKSYLADIKFINLALPHQKQVILSSATYSESCKEFIKEFVKDVQHICPNSNCILLGVVQKVTNVKYNSNNILQTRNRFKELVKILTKKQFKQCLIFCNYQVRVGEVYRMLTREKWPATQLYGAQGQIERLDALKTLQEYKCRILISTDLAARGIDASNVDLVVNFEPPFEWQTYLHRIGRAGRFGSYGIAITILSEGEEQKKFMNVLSAVNAPINLSPLWQGDESNDSVGEEIEQCESHDQSQLTNGSKDSVELWKVICNIESSPDKENIETFHKLCKSFSSSSDTTNNIETFSDLFMSFENNNVQETKELQYKCMSYPDVSAKHYLHRIKNKLQDIQKIQDSKEAYYPHNKFVIHVNGDQNTNESHIIEKQRIKSNDSFSINNSCRKNLKDLEIKDGKLKQEKNNSSAYVDRFVQNNYHQCQTTKLNYKKREQSSRHFNEDIKTQRQLASNCSIQSKLKKDSLNFSSKYNPISVENYYPRSLQDSLCDEQKKDKSTKTSNEKDFSTWYNQLKLKVRQIELAVYIDEVSKLY